MLVNWVLFCGSRFVPPFLWLSAVGLIYLFREPNSPTLGLGPNLFRATVGTPAEGVEAAGEAEGVEETTPPTVQPV